MLAGARSAAVAALLCAFAFPALAHVTLFGPKTYTSPAGAPQTLTERFDANGRCDASAGATYTLVIANGDANGSARVTAATISLNGTEVVTEKDFAQKPATIERAVTLVPTGNALAITIKAPKQSKLTVSLRRHIDVTEPVFVEKTFPIGNARQSFNVADLTGMFELVVVPSKLTGGGIFLNGTKVVTTQELKGATAAIRKAVILRAANELAVELTGAATSSAKVSIVRHVLDTNGPLLTLSGIADGQTFATTPLLVSGTVADFSGVSTLMLNGVPVPIGAGGAFSASVPLTGGANALVFVATDCEGNGARKELTVHLQTSPAPQVTIAAPASGALVSSLQLPVSGTFGNATAVTVNGAAMTLAANAWSGTVTLTGADGARTITAVATDGTRQAMASVQVTLDTTAPAVTIVTPREGVPHYNDAALAISGTVVDATSGIGSVTCNGAAATLAGNSFSCTATLVPGANVVTIVATDRAGNSAEIMRNVIFATDHDAPAITAEVIPPPNAAGWTRGPARVVFHCSDALSGIADCTGDVMVLEEGAGIVVSGVARDRAGNTAPATITINVDNTRPVISLGSTPPAVVPSTSYQLAGTVTDALSGVASLTCGNVTALRAGDMFTCNLTLIPGTNTVELEARDRNGNTTIEALRIRVDDVGPTVSFGAPDVSPVTTSEPAFAVVGYAYDESGATATLNGEPVTVVDGRFDTVVPLAEGTNVLTLTATDPLGNTSSVSTTIERVTPARILITSPDDLATFGTSSVDVRGTVSPANATVVVNDVVASVTNGTFIARNVPLAQGKTSITAIATSPFGRVATANLSIYRDSIPPRVEVYVPAAGAVVNEPSITVSGMVDDIVVGTINGAQVSVTVNGVAAEVSNRAFLARGVTVTPGANTLTIVATDQGANRTTITHGVTFDAGTGSARIERVSGQNQSAVIGAKLPQPLVVRVLDAAGAPVANVPVVFTIEQNNGTLASGDTSDRTVTVPSNAQGHASVEWTLGTRAGAGNNRVEVKAAGFAGSIEFLAAARTGEPAQIVVDSGANQFGGVSEPLQRPLVAVVVDAGGNRIAGVPVTFNVVEGGGNIAGEQSFSVETDSDGRAWVTPSLGPDEGNDNNIFNATFNGTTGVLFQASARKTGDPAQTRISGVVLDNSNVPIAGVSVRVDESTQSVQTDAAGQFVLHAAPVGYVKLIIDGSTTERPGTWPTLEFVLHTLPGTDNSIGMPIYLLPIDLARGIQVDERNGGTLTIPELPGFSLTIAPGSALFPNGSRAGTVSATLVHSDKVPMVPGFGQQPKFIVTIQPTGVHFDPPAALTFPNVDGLAPGEITEMYSFDHDLGQFVAIGTGMVSEDGTVVQSDPGVGIIKGGWHCGGNPTASGNASCVKVSLKGPKYGKVGQLIPITATGTPAGGTYFGWQVVDDPADPNDDPSIASFTTQPSCAGQATCTAQLKATRGGRVSLKVSYQGPGGGSSAGNVATNAGESTEAKILTVDIPQFEMSAIRFNDSGLIHRDRSGAQATPIYSAQWIAAAGGQPAAEEPVTYPRGHKMELSFQLKIEPGPALSGVKFEGKGPDGIIFRAENVQIPAGASYLPNWVTAKADQPLPDATKYYPSFTIEWSYTLPDSTEPVSMGTTTNPMYVTLAKPLPGMTIYLSTLRLAVERGGATDAATALQNTWSFFAGPANVATWEGRPLHYYATGSQLSAGAYMGTNVARLLAEGNGECLSFVRLLASSLAHNGISAEWISINAKTANDWMMVNEWAEAPPVSPGGPPAGLPLLSGAYRYILLFNEDRLPSNHLDPPQPGDIYGHLRSLPDLPGQNTRPPMEKIFLYHSQLRPVLPAGSSIMLQGSYDPSYGQTFVGEIDFEARAIWGYTHSQEVIINGEPRSDAWVAAPRASFPSNILFTPKTLEP
jgi:hypothetical protein